MIARAGVSGYDHCLVPATGHQVLLFSLEHPDYERIASISGTSAGVEIAPELAGIATIGDDEHVACGNGPRFARNLSRGDPARVGILTGVNRRPISLIFRLVIKPVTRVVDQKAVVLTECMFVMVQRCKNLITSSVRQKLSFKPV